MNEKTLKGIIVVVLVLGGGGTTGAMLAMNENQVQYDALLVEFQDLTGGFNSLTTDYDGLLESYDALSESYDILTGEYNSLNESYYALLEDYNTLVDDFNELSQTYNTLVADYNTLSAAYDNLFDLYSQLLDNYSQLTVDYQLLFEQYTILTTWIRQQILPAQYMVFAEAVRRYYFEDFYVQNKWNEGNTSGYWTEFTRFCRDVILHDSQIGYSPLAGSWFPHVSNALAGALRYGSQTEHLAYENFYWAFYPWVYLWSGDGKTGNALTDITNVVQWCVDEIDYEYDSEITRLREPYDWDYIKFPVETAFRTMGDCEDQAMLVATHLESCGFDTMMVVIHDPLWEGSGLYHGAAMIWWNTTAWGARPAGTWGFYYGSMGGKYVYGEGWWVFLDTTWNTPFGTDPTWLQWYAGTDITRVFNYEVFSYGVCDYNGWVSYTPTVGMGSEAFEAYVP